jgi:hypothetical protein
MDRRAVAPFLLGCLVVLLGLGPVVGANERPAVSQASVTMPPPAASQAVGRPPVVAVAPPAAAIPSPVKAIGRVDPTLGALSPARPEPVRTLSPSPSPSPEPTAAPTPRPAPKPTPEPTRKPTPKSTPKATPKPAPVATPKPAPSPTPKPSPSPTPTPSPSPTYAGTSKFWYPAVGISAGWRWYGCDYGGSPSGLGEGIYRWGCGPSSNIYLLSHASSTFRAIQRAYHADKLKVGQSAWYADAKGNVSQWKVAWIRRVTLTYFNRTASEWAVNASPTPIMTLQTCDGANSEYRIIVRLVPAG